MDSGIGRDPIIETTLDLSFPVLERAGGFIIDGNISRLDCAF